MAKKQIPLENLTDIFNDFRMIQFSEKRADGKRYQVKNVKEAGEIFFSIEYGRGSSKRGSKHGYLKINDLLRTYLDKLFQDRIDNAHLDIIEWDDSFNIVVEDGLYISSLWLRAEKQQVADLFNVPVQPIKEDTTHGYRM